jgi:hypothetical protein
VLRGTVDTAAPTPAHLSEFLWPTFTCTSAAPGLRRQQLYPVIDGVEPTQLTRSTRDAEREQRRAADRAFVQQAVEALRSSDGWQRWLTTRGHFHTYSPLISVANVAGVEAAVVVVDMSSTRINAIYRRCCSERRIPDAERRDAERRDAERQPAGSEAVA